MTNLRLLWALALFIPTFAACRTMDSGDLKTRGIVADLTVESNGSSTAVKAVLKTQSALTYVNLTEGDRISVSYRGREVSLRESNLAGAYRYTASLPAGLGGEEVTFILLRPADESAPDSSCRLPEEFAFSGRLSPFSRSKDDLTVSWSGGGLNPAELATVEFSGVCFHTFLKALPDNPGTYTLGAGKLKDRTTVGQDCSVSVKVTVARTGKLDPAFGGGKAVCSQVRRTTVSSTP